MGHRLVSQGTIISGTGNPREYRVFRGSVLSSRSVSARLTPSVEPMRIILFRHAPAEARDPERWPDDAVRPLTARGESRGRRAARGILRLEPGVTRVLASPALRALDTAVLLAHELDPPHKPHPLASLAPGGSWRETLKALAHEPADCVVVLVGHEPDLGKFAGVLLFGAPTAMPLKKAGACSIEAEAAEAGAGQLRWFLAPATLRRLGRKWSKV